MGEWKEYRLGEVCSKIGSGATPSGGKDAYKGGDFALIRSQNVIDFEFNHNGLAYINDLQARKLDGVIVNPEDILLNITGDSVARTCIVDPSILPARVNQHVAIIRINPKVADAKFIHAWLIYKKQELLNLASFGATRNAITKRMIENFIVQLPAIIEQKKIADILSALDDKIETNRKINARLEELVQGLFKSWFIDFEPFGGVMPEGWKYKAVANFPHEIETGKRPKGGVSGIIEGIPSIGAESIKGIGYYDYSKTKYIPYEYAATLNKGRINDFDLLIYKDGGKPGYFIPDFSMMGLGFPFKEMFLNEHVFRLNFGKPELNIFAYFFFRTDDVTKYLNSVGGKAAIPGINQKNVEDIEILDLNIPQIQKFGTVVFPIFCKILENCKESARLAELRDALLPKLMSGEIKVG